MIYLKRLLVSLIVISSYLIGAVIIILSISLSPIILLASFIITGDITYYHQELEDLKEKFDDAIDRVISSLSK